MKLFREDKLKQKQIMTAQIKNAVTQNPERKLRKKIRNAKTESEKVELQKQLETFLSRKQVNEVQKKQKLRKKQKITDDQAFQDAKKYNSSMEAKTKSKLTDLKEMKKESVRQSHAEMKQKLKEKKKYREDMFDEICCYKVEESNKIDERIRELTNTLGSDKRAQKQVEKEIIQECHERVLREYKIQEIAKGENISVKEASDMLDHMLDQLQKMIQSNQ